ncbi:hypothetical protein [Nocardia sp. bgisy118]|uniref:hypothetical protein n=1 Tax=Nocardia sp. bgisy118 TaxID=3413786 RepID=UPI003F4A62B3
MPNRKERRAQARTEKRLAKKRTSADRPLGFVGSTHPDLTDGLVREAEQQPTVVLCAHVGLMPVESEDRAATLQGLGLRKSLRLLAALQAKLDVAATTDWSERRVEKDFLTAIPKPWASRARARLDRGDRVLLPRSLGQLTREIIENSSTDDSAPGIDEDMLGHFAISITTENSRTEFSDTGLATSEAVQRIQAEVSNLDAEQSLTMLRELMLDQVATLLYDAPEKLEILHASVQDIWLKPWPPGRNGLEPLGETPAAAFAASNKVEFLDILTLGHIVSNLSKKGLVEFGRDKLLAAGASEEAVEFLWNSMALTLRKYRSRLSRDRSRGAVANQRYTMTERPFLILDDNTALLLRHQWGIDRFFGNPLYWDTFFNFGRLERGSPSEAFSQAMNYVFERRVGESLERIVSFSPAMTRLITESELQAYWTERAGQLPKACDWVITAGRVCFVIDATNHHLNANLSQGVGSVEEFEAELEKHLVDKKLQQLAATMRQLRSKGREEFGVPHNAIFVPIIVIPDNGLPNLALTDFDFQYRSKSSLQEFDGNIYPPTILPLSSLLILEGLAELFEGRRDIAKLIVSWRRSCTNAIPVTLQSFLETLRLPRPIPTRMLKAHRQLKELLDGRVS